MLVQQITEGMTPSQFLVALNTNLAILSVIRGVASYTPITNTDDYVTKINSDFGESIVNFGMGGSEFANSIKYNFETKQVIPVNPTIAYGDMTSKVKVDLVTPDGYGETCHPSVVDTGKAKWNGYRYWMANTPYHARNVNFEKICIWASNDGFTWVVPAGVTNPIFTPTVTTYDPDLYFENGVMYLVYISYGAKSGHVLMRHSTDAINWSDEIDLYYGTGYNTSPSLIKIGNKYYIYYSDIGEVSNDIHVQRVSCDTIDGTYANKETISITRLVPWEFNHIEIFEANGYYYLIIASSSGGFVIGKSSDGINFTRSSNFIITDLGYRATAIYVDGVLLIYYTYELPSDEWWLYRVNAFLF